MATPIKPFQVGDRVEMKKEHPCGSRIWKVLRTGADVRMECEGCRHQVMLPRVKFEKGMKRVIAPDPIVPAADAEMVPNGSPPSPRIRKVPAPPPAPAGMIVLRHREPRK